MIEKVTINEIVNKIARVINPRKIILFGSYFIFSLCTFAQLWG